MSREVQILGPLEQAPGHGFADPAHLSADRGTMTMMLSRFGNVLDGHAHEPGPLVDYFPHEERWSRRVMIPEPHALASQSRVTLVGFFGRRRHDATPEVCARIDELSGVLFRAIPDVDGVFAYMTQLLVDEYNYANLVLVESPAVIERWRQTAPHPAAAVTVSPEYYEHVRIYNGVVTVAGMADSRALELHSVKYWDFRQRPTWLAERHYRAATEAQAS